MENKGHDHTYEDVKGKTTVAPEVMLTIARLTTLEVPGVSRMSNTPGGFNRWLSRGVGEGVRLDIKNDTVSADIYVVLQEGVNIREISRNVQLAVNRSFSEMVGMQVGRVNVHIEDIDYPSETEMNEEAEG